MYPIRSLIRATLVYFAMLAAFALACSVLLGVFTPSAAAQTGVYQLTPPTLTNGQRNDLRLDATGALVVQGPIGSAADPLISVETTSASTALGGLFRSSTSAEATTGSFVVKASGGNLYDVNVAGGAAAGFIMVFNAATVPADGVVAPLLCLPVAINGVLDTSQRAPISMSTGISIAFSSTGCFTKTAAAVGFIEVTYR